MALKTSALDRHKCKAKRHKGANEHSKRQTPEYWEARLKRMGLTLRAGRNIGAEDLTYGHLINNFGEWEGRIIYEPPTGERLDAEDWPISLC